MIRSDGGSTYSHVPLARDVTPWHTYTKEVDANVDVVSGSETDDSKKRIMKKKEK